MSRQSRQQQLHVSVVIVNWNAGEALLDCIASVEKQRKCAGRSFLIDTILVDNDSADNSVALVRDAFPNVKVICAGENLGFARANNLAFEQIQSEFVLLLNPDAVLADDAVAKMLDVALADSRIGIVGCKILNPDGTTEELGIQSFPIPLTEFISMLFGRFRTCEVLRSVLPYHDPQKDGEVVKLYGACLLLRREALMEAEGFDDQFFMYCEDVDLCFRLQALGWKVFYLSTAEAVHLKGRSSSIRGVEFKTRTMFESLLKLVEKHRGSRAVWPYKVALAVAALARFAAVSLMSLFFRETARVSEVKAKYVTILKLVMKSSNTKAIQTDAR